MLVHTYMSLVSHSKNNFFLNYPKEYLLLDFSIMHWKGRMFKYFFKCKFSKECKFFSAKFCFVLGF